MLISYFKQLFVPEIPFETVCKRLRSTYAAVTTEACISLCRRLTSAKAIDPTQLPLGRLLKEIKCVWFRARRVFSPVLTDSRVITSAELDVTDCLWQTYACAWVADVMLNGSGVQLPRVRGRSFAAGQMLRVSMDERAFRRMYMSHEPRPKVEEVLNLCRVVACAANAPENDRTEFTDTEFALRNGVVSLCESFAEIAEVSTRRFCKLASRFALCYERAEAYVGSRRIFRTNDAVLAKRVRTMQQLSDRDDVKLLLASSTPAAIQLANKLCLPLMALEEALGRMNASAGAAVDPATVLAQSVGIRKSNALRQEGKLDGCAVLKTPDSHYYDAWTLVGFDRLLAGSSDFSILQTCVLLDHQWHEQYLRLHRQIDEMLQGPALPFIVRIAHRWYVSVACNLDKLPSDALIRLSGTEHKEIPANGSVLIQCGDINACLSVWYLIVKEAFGGKLTAHSSIQGVCEHFDS